MQIEWYDSVDDVGAERIAPLEGSPVDFSYGILRAVEKSLWGDLEVRYLCVESGRDLLAFTPIYYGTNIEFLAVMPQAIQSSYHGLVAGMGLGHAYRVAVVGSLPSDRGYIPMHPDCNRDEVIDSLIQAADEFCRASKLHLLVIKDINQEFPAIDRLRAAGFVETYSLPTVRLNTTFASKDDYIKSLTANGRSHARRALKKAAKEFTIRTVDDFEPLVSKMYPLWRATYLKAKFKLEELSPLFFLECARTTPPFTELLVCEREGKLVGGYLIYYYKDQQLNKRIGIDYSEKKSGLVYTALNYHCILRAIERQIPISYFGQTTYTPKLRMGGYLENQYLFLKAYRLSVRMGFSVQRKWMQRYRAEVIQKQVKGGKTS